MHTRREKVSCKCEGKGLMQMRRERFHANKKGKGFMQMRRERFHANRQGKVSCKSVGKSFRKSGLETKQG